jgi:hypothetical protein
MIEPECLYHFCCEICPLNPEDCPITQFKQEQKEIEEQEEIREIEGMF